MSSSSAALENPGIPRMLWLIISANPAHLQIISDAIRDGILDELDIVGSVLNGKLEVENAAWRAEHKHWSDLHDPRDIPGQDKLSDGMLDLIAAYTGDMAFAAFPDPPEPPANRVNPGIDSELWSYIDERSDDRHYRHLIHLAHREGILKGFELRSAILSGSLNEEYWAVKNNRGHWNTPAVIEEYALVEKPITLGKIAKEAIQRTVNAIYRAFPSQRTINIIVRTVIDYVRAHSGDPSHSLKARATEAATEAVIASASVHPPGAAAASGAAGTGSTNPGLSGGYYNKYLKYKNKYLSLKKSSMV